MPLPGQAPLCEAPRRPPEADVGAEQEGTERPVSDRPTVRPSDRRDGATERCQRPPPQDGRARPTRLPRFNRRPQGQTVRVWAPVGAVGVRRAEGKGPQGTPPAPSPASVAGPKTTPGTKRMRTRPLLVDRCCHWDERSRGRRGVGRKDRAVGACC